MRQYFVNIAVGVSILLNAVLAGENREMLSSRAYRRQVAYHWYMAMIIIDIWFATLFGDYDHCKKCWEYDQKIAKVTREP